MWTALKRILKAGFVDFWRNGVVSLSSTLVMTVTLFTIGAVIFLQAILSATLIELQSKVDVNVYFVTTALEGDIRALQDSLLGLPEVDTVEYISREEALVDFRERHEDDQLTLQALEELEENPLGAVLNIRAKETSQYEGIATFLDTSDINADDGTPIIDTINYFQNKIAIDRLTTIIDSSETFGYGLAFVLVFLSVLITFNTIRLAIYTSREEISVMRLVGANNIYIRGPFAVEGTLAGVFAALIALMLFYPLTYWLGPITNNFFSGLNIFKYYLANFPQIFLIIMGSGIVLGILASLLAIRKYLKV
jgi:cell division transport system permease protein